MVCLIKVRARTITSINNPTIFGVLYITLDTRSPIPVMSVVVALSLHDLVASVNDNEGNCMA